ncbi:MAG: four helix bundle protein [Planctomycetota bacterium]|nr:four helix bundle protein [Planctomycetota bacterium]
MEYWGGAEGSKSKEPRTKQAPMPEKSKSPKYDLEERTFRFAQRVRILIRKLPRTLTHAADAKQLARSSGSVGANYIEANEGLGKKDFQMHIKMCRKEAKECSFFLRLLDTAGTEALEVECSALIQESRELVSIFSAIIKKTT